MNINLFLSVNHFLTVCRALAANQKTTLECNVKAHSIHIKSMLGIEIQLCYVYDTVSKWLHGSGHKNIQFIFSINIYIITNVSCLRESMLAD